MHYDFTDGYETDFDPLFSDEPDDVELCPACDGSGEDPYLEDFSLCSSCGGQGYVDAE